MPLLSCAGARQLRRPWFLAIAAGENPILRVVLVLVLRPRRSLPRTILSTLMRPHHHEHFPRPTSDTPSTPPTSTSTSTLVFLSSSTTSAWDSSSQPGTIALTSSAAEASIPSTTISPQTGSTTPSLASDASSSPAFKSTLSTAAIAGLSVAAVAIVAVILGLFIWRRRRCKAQIPHGAEGEDEEEGRMCLIGIVQTPNLHFIICCSTSRQRAVFERDHKISAKPACLHAGSRLGKLRFAVIS